MFILMNIKCIYTYSFSVPIDKGRRYDPIGKTDIIFEK